MRSWWSPMLCLGVAACVSHAGQVQHRAAPPRQDEDLARALLVYESVPRSHPQHAAAQAAARLVEQRLRKSQALLSEGLELRAQGCFAQALATFQQARTTWAHLPGIEALIVGTENRLRGQELAGQAQESAEPTTVPMAASPAPSQPVEPAIEIQPVAQPAQPAAEPAADPVAVAEVLPRPAGRDRSVAEPSPPELPPVRTDSTLVFPPEPDVAAAIVDGEIDAVGLGLIAVEVRLGQGDLEQAIGDLMRLAKRFPGDRRAGLRMARLMHQRALLRYGEGNLASAIADWDRVLNLEPQNEQAQQMRAAAMREAGLGATPR